MAEERKFTIKYREPTPEEEAERAKRRVTFADGTKGLIMNPLDTDGKPIVSREHPLSIFVFDFSNVEIVVSSAETEVLGESDWTLVDGGESQLGEGRTCGTDTR